MPKTKVQPALNLTGDFYVEPGDRNPYGRITGYKLMDRKGNRIATMTTKTGAQKVAEICNRALSILQREGEHGTA